MFAALTLLAPLLLFHNNTPNGPARPEPFEQVVFLFMVLASLYIGGKVAAIAALCGVASSLIGLLRRERSSWLSAIGLVWGAAVLAVFALSWARGHGP